MMSCQSFSLTEKLLRRSLVVKHGVVKVAERLPCLDKLRVDLSGSLVTRPRVIQTVRTTLRAKLDDVATHAPKPR